MLGFKRERAGNALPGITPSNTYPTRDGRFVIIGANSDAIFKRLMQAIGRDELATAPDLATNAGRVPHAGELDAAIEAWTQEHDLAAVLKALEAADVPCGRVYDAEDIANDLHYRARGMLEQWRLPDGQPMRIPGIVPKLTETPGATRWLGPAVGAHTDEVLGELGFSRAEIDGLRTRGVV